MGLTRVWRIREIVRTPRDEGATGETDQHPLLIVAHCMVSLRDIRVLVVSIQRNNFERTP